MDCKSEQESELEVLNSIYEGDPCFHPNGNHKMQYKFGEEGHFKSFVMEVVWTATYPESVPEVNLDLFYNSHVTREGWRPPFSLIEYVKEHLEELVKEQVDPALLKLDELKIENGDEKKDSQMTKTQKRRMWDKVEAGKCGQLERGHDWVDILKHLAQVGKAIEL